jgi:hypothetical protein
MWKRALRLTFDLWLAAMLLYAYSGFGITVYLVIGFLLSWVLMWWFLTCMETP